MSLLNFSIIGAAKAGTTAIAKALEQHPEVYMAPNKETNFFSLKDRQLDFFEGSVSKEYLANSCLDIESYRGQFIDVSTEKAVGEASPSYLYFPNAASHIRDYNPKIKLIAILRNPVERAYSNFLHHLRDDLETTNDFAEALSFEDERIEANWWWGFHYAKAGLYYNQVKAYLNIFPAGQIKIYLYEELLNSPDFLFQDIFRFLDIDDNFTPDLSIRENKTGVPKNKFLNRFLRDGNLLKASLKPLLPFKLRKQLIAKINSHNLERPSLDSEFNTQLSIFFRDDILKLQDLIGRDLSKWLRTDL
jgi:hypothetical protein